MHHFIIDAVAGSRARLDNIRLLQEVVEQVPVDLGLQPVMPPFLIPYYHGVVPEDCGLTAFVFLQGGHFTIHTFSFRQAFFADLLSPDSLDQEEVDALLTSALPCRRTFTKVIDRSPGALRTAELKPDIDFGPHLFLDIGEYKGPADLDKIFTFLDLLPEEIDMTPIMRPYVLKSELSTGAEILSGMTMIAESHISLHVFLDDQKAYLDLFSCRPFPVDFVLDTLKSRLRGWILNDVVVPRGEQYQLQRQESTQLEMHSPAWLQAVPKVRRT